VPTRRALAASRSIASRTIVASLTPAERACLRRLATPEKLQRFLDDLAYNTEPGGVTCRSPRRVLRDRVAHCMEGALLGAAALLVQGQPPLVLDLEAERDSDHVIVLYRRHGCWGAVAKSDFSGLRFRAPVYATLRELALSYYENYFNLRGERTLRRYSRPVNLHRFDQTDWLTAERPVWEIPTYLLQIPHRELLPRAAAKRFTRVDRRTFAAGRLGGVGH